MTGVGGTTNFQNKNHQEGLGALSYTSASVDKKGYTSSPFQNYLNAGASKLATQQNKVSFSTERQKVGSSQWLTRYCMDWSSNDSFYCSQWLEGTEIRFIQTKLWTDCERQLSTWKPRAWCCQWDSEAYGAVRKTPSSIMGYTHEEHTQPMQTTLFWVKNPGENPSSLAFEVNSKIFYI